MQNKNYITELGYKSLQDELFHLVTKERPELVKTVAWAAGNGDRSENGDYIYGKRRLREVDKKIRFLTNKIENSEVINHRANIGADKIFFGAEVTILKNNNIEDKIRIVGVDETNSIKNHISWVSPLAKSLLQKQLGDVFAFRSPSGITEIESTDINYDW
jgi:transcription elongation factor GreB